MKSVRPLCFLNDEEGYEYSLKGTCFVFMYRSELYAVTAKHVMSGWQGNQALVPYKLDSSSFFPILKQIEISTDEAEDTDHKDFTIFKIWMDEVDQKQFDKTQVFHVQNTKPSSTYKTIAIAGCPAELNYVDYDSKKIIWQPCYFVAKRIEDEQLAIERITFPSDTDLVSFNGLSGSPIFGFTSNPTKESHNAQWLGIVLRGTASSKVGYFVQSQVIIHAIELDIRAFK